MGGKFTANKGSDVPEFDAAVFAPKAKTGELIKPVKTAQYGWFVIKPLGASRPQDDAREEGDRADPQQARAEKPQQIASDWMRRS